MTRSGGLGRVNAATLDASVTASEGGSVRDTEMRPPYFFFSLGAGGGREWSLPLSARGVKRETALGEKNERHGSMEEGCARTHEVRPAGSDAHTHACGESGTDEGRRREEAAAYAVMERGRENCVLGF